TATWCASRIPTAGTTARFVSCRPRRTSCSSISRIRVKSTARSFYAASRSVLNCRRAPETFRRMANAVVLDGNSLTIEDVLAVANRSARVELSVHARTRIAASRRHVDALLERNAVAYGVTTGFGKLGDVVIPRERLAELQVNLVRSHTVGVGPLLPD